jgi:hypothetical protein
MTTRHSIFAQHFPSPNHQDFHCSPMSQSHFCFSFLPILDELLHAIRVPVRNTKKTRNAYITAYVMHWWTLSLIHRWIMVSVKHWMKKSIWESAAAAEMSINDSHSVLSWMVHSISLIRMMSLTDRKQVLLFPTHLVVGHFAFWSNRSQVHCLMYP